MLNPSAQQNPDPTTLVSTFNALPRNQLSLSAPGQVVFLISPAARYVHVEEPLPPTYTSATTEVKASIWSIILLKAFNEGLGATEEVRRAGATVGRPWSWVCNDAEMAGAVGEMLRSIGVQAPEGVGLARDEENGIADEEWRRFFGKLHNTVRMGQ